MCPKYHSPLKKSSNGTWVNYYTNQMVDLDGLWHYGEPNGREFENCSSYSETGEYVDVTCEDYLACFVCLWRDKPTFTLRGLCKETKIDRDYVFAPDLTHDQHVVFLGFYKNIILYDKAMNSRVIVEDPTKKLLQSSNKIRPESIVGTLIYEKENQMPFGLHVWNVTDCNGKTFGKLTSVSFYVWLEKLYTTD